MTGMTLVQVGAGAGDLDPRANFRDGFTEYVKRLNPSQIERILPVEPNPINIPMLRQCWKDYGQAEILQIGIRPFDSAEGSQIFYYAEEDRPHYQVFSMIEAYVRKHYPQGTIQSVTVDTITISQLMHMLGGKHIDVLALDIEGIDAEII